MGSSAGSKPRLSGAAVMSKSAADNNPTRRAGNSVGGENDGPKHPPCPPMPFSLFTTRHWQGEKMRELIGFVIAYALYLSALWVFLQNADLSIRVIA